MKNREFFYNEIETICESSGVDWQALDGRTILVTGATGLIGSSLVTALLYFAEKKGIRPRVAAFVRNRAKAEKMFGSPADGGPVIVTGDIRDPLRVEGDVDYIVHCASETASRAFIDTPVDTIEIACAGAKNVLELAVEKQVRSAVYLSTMEVYGAPQTDERIREDHGTDLITTDVRSSYPESKRLCESLCAAYCRQYGVPVKILRLTQTFGPGVRYDDRRVFAEFARCAMEERDIVLHTSGATKRMYLYTLDAVTAILAALLKGENGRAYNAANEATYCSILEMAETALSGRPSGARVLVKQEDNAAAYGYAPILHMNLDTSGLRALGWKPERDLREMFESLYLTMEKEDTE